MKKNSFKKINLILLVTAAFVHSNAHAVLGVLLVASQGPSIPKVMETKQIFEKKIPANTCVVSDNPKIVRATMVEKTFVLEALQPGETTVCFEKTNKEKDKTSKQKKTDKNTITVAYNNITEIPKTIKLNTVLYCTTTKPISHDASCKNTGIKISKKRKGNKFFYEIKCKTAGTLVLTDGTTTRSITITPTEVAPKNKTQQKKCTAAKTAKKPTHATQKKVK